MAIMVGNGANAGALSPFAPTGIIVNGIMAKNQMPGLETTAYLYNLGAHALMAFGGYALFGGLRLFAAERTVEVVDPEGGRAFNRRQWITLGVIAALLVSVLAFGAHVGLAAFVAAVLLVAAGAADDGEAIKLMPWRVIVMVTGVTVLIALVERFQGIDLMVSLVARISTAGTVTGVVALLTGIVSVYSSTSGVVLPAFLPLAPGLAAQLPGASAVGIAMSMNIGGHLVDVSPLSTIGALCIAGAGARAIPGGCSTSCWRGACRWRSPARCSVTCCSDARGKHARIVDTQPRVGGGGAGVRGGDRQRRRPECAGVPQQRRDPDAAVFRPGLNGGERRAARLRNPRGRSHGSTARFPDLVPAYWLLFTAAALLLWRTAVTGRSVRRHGRIRLRRRRPLCSIFGRTASSWPTSKGGPHFAVPCSGPRRSARRSSSPRSRSRSRFSPG